tara:strand:+ start:507 stop:725 length:219 start_codon:yes stop_codon:yes gene_type:complete
MGTFFIVIYLVSFCLLVGGGFAMMYANLKSINEMMSKPIKKPSKPSNPPKSVNYVDGSFDAARKRFEDLYND